MRCAACTWWLRFGMFWFALLAGTSVTPTARADGRTDGYFLRAAPGIGYTASSESGVAWSGAGFFGSFSVGRFFAKSLALHVDSFGNILSGASVRTADGRSGNVSVSEYGIGAGLTYYFMPLNLYVSPSFGTGLAQEDASVAGLAGMRLVRSHPDLLNQRVLQVVTADGGASYVLSCAVDETRLASERDTCERIVKSFRFTKAR